jgi:hypothetical protein
MHRAGKLIGLAKNVLAIYGVQPTSKQGYRGQPIVIEITFLLLDQIVDDALRFRDGDGTTEAFLDTLQASRPRHDEIILTEVY